MKPEKISAFITRYRRVGVLGATAAAVATPFCSCGTTAVILGMVASTIPWAPIVAFMVASPLTSPEELVYSAGLFGWPFAIAFFVSSILLGLLGGLVADFCESRGWLANQARFNSAPAAPAPVAARQPAVQFAYAGDPQSHLPLAAPGVAPAQDARVYESSACGCGAPALIPQAQSSTCGCESALAAFLQTEPASSGSAPAAAPQASSTCGCGSAEPPSTGKTLSDPVTARQFAVEVYRTGKQLLIMFLGFAFIGYLLNGLIPSTWVSAIFGKGNAYSVPLAAILGLPLYINTEASLPLVRALIDGGMSQGAALAFLITGAGTSVGAMAGALTIARWRVIALVVGTLVVGAAVIGSLYNLILLAA